MTSPYHPANNGKVESVVKTVKTQHFSITMMIYHDTQLCVNLPTPAELIFGRWIHTDIPSKTVYEQEEEHAHFVQKHNRYLKSAGKIHAFQLDQLLCFQDPVTKQWFKGIIDKWLHSEDSYIC